MRIVSWNCNGKFREKFDQITRLNADIYIIQECENPKSCSHARYQTFSNNYIWVGDNKNKGLGVFAGPQIQLSRNNWQSYCLRHFLSVRINDAFDLLAVWAGKPYIGEYYIYQSVNIDRYSPNMIIIGDFNSNAVWDKDYPQRSHSDVVRELKAIGLESIYHVVSGESQGSESQNTFYLYRHADKGYHIDHCFANPKMICSYQIEKDPEWLTLSDHLPIVIDRKQTG